MYGLGPRDAGEAPTPCAADGPVSATGTVLEAVECDSARYVAMAPVARGVNRTYLILTRTSAEGTVLPYADATAIPEVQNALAHFGPRTKSVRVLTHPGRRRPLTRLLDEVDERGNRAFEYAGETFRLVVRVG